MTSHTIASEGDVALPLSTEPAETEQSPHLQLIEIAAAIWKARALYAAAQLKLPDLIANGERSADELAHATGTHAASLRRLMRALASCGVVTEVQSARFRLTPLGSALMSGAPGAARSTVLTLAGDWQWKAWANFLYSIQTGQPAVRKSLGKPLFEYLAAHPEDSAQFNDAMVGMHGADGAAIVEAYDFSSLKTIVDLGGGTGTLLTTILQSNPHLQGTLFELAETALPAQRLIETSGLSERCDVVVGDFFKEVPARRDAYILAHVLHDWTDEQAVPILENCRRSMPRHSRLLIIEAVLPPGDTAHPGKLMDLLMLTVTGGMERTAEDFAAMLGIAQFKITRIIPISGQQSVIEAIPI
jgi:hypothetical protein